MGKHVSAITIYLFDLIFILGDLNRGSKNHYSTVNTVLTNIFGYRIFSFI